MAEGTRPVAGSFVREATGLVREVGPWSGMIFNIIWTGNAVGLTAAFVLYSFVFVSPGMNIVALILTATVLSTLNAAVYMFFSLAMPRSGGDYAFISRTLHPSLGFMSGINWALWLPLVLGWTGSQVVPIAFQSLFASYGAISHNQALIDFTNGLFSSKDTVFAVGAIFIIVFSLITLLGNRVYFLIQNIAFIFMAAAIVITVLAFAGNAPESYAALIDRVAGQGAYQSLLSAFSSNGGYQPRPYATSVLSGVVLWAGINTWAMGTSLIAGEIRKAGELRTWAIANILASLSVGLLFALTAYLYFRSVGSDLIYAASYLYGTDSYKLPFPPYYSSYVILAIPNLLLFIVFAIGFFLGGIFYMPQNQILASRMFLAFSFDRLMPKKLGDVSERFHVPVYSILLALAISLVSLWIYVYTNWLGFFSQLFAVAFSFFVTSIAAILFPFRRRELFENSPANIRVAGVPVMTLLGIGNALFMALFIYENWVDSALGSNSIQSITLITSVLAISFVAYWIIRAIRRRQGIDIDLLYRQIPPE
jgi:amino acid transporter